MVNRLLKNTMVGIILTIVFCQMLFGQKNVKFPSLAKYSKFGIITAPVLYDRAKIYPKYGDYTFQNKPLWGFNAGFEYDFFPDRKWSLVTALLVAYEPVYNVKYRILKKDLFKYYDDDLIENFKSYGYYSFSIPVFVRMNIQASKRTFINFLTGIKVMYFPQGSCSLIESMIDIKTLETREIFGLKLSTQDFSIYPSIIVGTGATFALNKVLLKTNLVYVMNLCSTIKGEYQFGNLFSSPPSRGDYKLLGNYWGLWFTLGFKKSKNKWIEIMSQKSKGAVFSELGHNNLLISQ